MCQGRIPAVGRRGILSQSAARRGPFRGDVAEISVTGTERSERTSRTREHTFSSNTQRFSSVSPSQNPQSECWRESALSGDRRLPVKPGSLQGAGRATQAWQPGGRAAPPPGRLTSPQESLSPLTVYVSKKGKPPLQEGYTNINRVASESPAWSRGHSQGPKEQLRSRSAGFAVTLSPTC